MSRLVWDQAGERFYETGTKNGVLYVRNENGEYPKGVVWNGLTAVTQAPSGAESNPLYADDIKYVNLISAEEFGATIEAYTYPDEFAECDGSASIAEGVVIGQQKRKTFGLCYRSVLGNDIDENDYGYKLHLIYGAVAAPSEKSYATINDSPEAVTFSWEVTTTPVNVTGFKPTALLTIDSTKIAADKLSQLEDILYGTENEEARLPLPDEVIALVNAKDPITLSVAPEDGEVSVLGKKVSDLQTNVSVDDDKITGTLKYVTGYTGFSSNVSEQKGNYLVLKLATEPADAKTTVELVGGTKGPVALDEDMNIVLLIKNKNTQSVKVVTTKNDDTVTKTYSLSALTLNAE